MSWSTPKTDWNGETVDGVYTGDRFNAVDFNRIKNNLEYLRELAIKMYDEFAIQSVGSDKTVKDYFYADEINALEANLVTINTHSLKRSYGTAPTYAANGNTMDASLVNLCVDICQRNGKSKLLWLGDKNKTLAYAPKSDEMVLTVHRWFANKSCPGDWLYNRLGNLAAEVTKRLTGGSTDTGKVDVPSDGKTLYRVQTGAFSKRPNADAWAAKLKAAGFDTYIVQMGNLYKVQVGAYSQKSNAENMMAKLKAAGYDAFITTKSGTAAGTAKKSAAEIAKEIYNGTCSDARWSSWGNGADRVNRLKQAGYDPSEVQSEVNKLF